MLHMMFIKLGMETEKSWNRLRGFSYLAKVIIGIEFRDGVEVKEEEPEGHLDQQAIHQI